MASTLFFFNCVTTCSFLYELIIDTFGNCKPLLFHSFRASSVGSEKTLIFSGALPGFIVETGQDVIVIESMKMENPVVSNVSGTVVSIFVVEGEMVDEDQKLIELNTKD